MPPPTLRFGDGAKVSFENRNEFEAFLKCSPLLNRLVAEETVNLEIGEPISLPSVATEKTFRRIFEYCGMFSGLGDLRGPKELRKRERSFLEKRSQKMLFGMLRAAEYLEVPRLKSAIVAFIAETLVNSTAGELNRAFATTAFATAPL